MVRLFSIAILFYCANLSYAQTVETDRFLGERTYWMKMGQDYWIIPIVEKGIYRISVDELIKKGFPSLEDTLNFQYELFSRCSNSHFYTSRKGKWCRFLFGILWGGG